MLHFITLLSKYLMILCFLIYSFECFHVFRYETKIKKQKSIYKNQKLQIFLIHFTGYFVLYYESRNMQLIGFFLMQCILFGAIYLVYHLFYKKASELLLNNMIMLSVIGLIMLTRISFDKALKQFIIMAGSAFICLLIPEILQGRNSFFRKLTWLYAILGIGALSLVLLAGNKTFGAKLAISFGGVTVQPSEFIKIVFVFFIASMLYKKNDFKQVVITSIFAAMHVLVLVASRDLGGALLYFVTYLALIYVATRKLYYFAGGLALAGMASVISYKLFSHVRVRVIAWQDPLKVIDNEGYQIGQSLFGIGTGGWFGLGLGKGLPKKIPVVEQDFIFAIISEELGGIFALCLIMVCISCFLMIFNISMQMKDQFYKLVALGLGTVYGFQVFLTIGGVIKFIPLTGVTLPLVSYGGSSILSTMIIFGTVQALYIMKGSNSENDTKKQKQNAKKK